MSQLNTILTIRAALLFIRVRISHATCQFFPLCIGYNRGWCVPFITAGESCTSSPPRVSAQQPKALRGWLRETFNNVGYPFTTGFDKGFSAFLFLVLTETWNNCYAAITVITQSWSESFISIWKQIAQQSCTKNTKLNFVTSNLYSNKKLSIIASWKKHSNIFYYANFSFLHADSNEQMQIRFHFLIGFAKKNFFFNLTLQVCNRTGVLDRNNYE